MKSYSNRNSLLLLTFLWLVAFSIYPKASFSQTYFYNDRYYENNVVIDAGLTGGVFNALTDLGGKKGAGKGFLKDLRWVTARPAFGVYFTALYKSFLGIRLEAGFGQVAGYDSILKNVAGSTGGRYERNLSFKSPVNELQLGLELHPFYLLNWGGDVPRLSPYAIAGGGVYHFDPQAQLDGQWYSLQPLSLEGQGFREYRGRKPYSLTQFNMNMGAGLKYEINALFHIRAELLHRVLFTDYLDDVSRDYIDPSLFSDYLPANLATTARRLYSRRQELNPADITVPGQKRGNPRKNDAFFSIMLKLGVTLGRVKR